MSETTTAPQLDASLTRLVAVEAQVDPRSVEKAVKGEPLRASVERRVQQAIKSLTRRGKLPPLEG